MRSDTPRGEMARSDDEASRSAVRDRAAHQTHTIVEMAVDEERCHCTSAVESLVKPQRHDHPTPARASRSRWRRSSSSLRCDARRERARAGRSSSTPPAARGLRESQRLPRSTRSESHDSLAVVLKSGHLVEGLELGETLGLELTNALAGEVHDDAHLFEGDPAAVRDVERAGLGQLPHLMAPVRSDTSR